MKRNWLRGVLLGVSLALLLSGGVALGAPRVSAEPWCGVCCDSPLPTVEEEVSWFPTCDDFFTITTRGWGALERVSMTVSSPGPRPPFRAILPVFENSPTVGRLYLMCWPRDDRVKTSVDGFHWAAALTGLTEDDYGRWTVLVEGDSDAVEAEFYFAEEPGVCRAMEFVPEPGSILLLASGLAGLAGYATLRLRSGQVLRLRSGQAVRRRNRE